MKRIFLAFTLAAIMLFVALYNIPKPFYKTLGYFPSGSKVTIYCRKTSVFGQNVGNGFLVECDLSDFAEVFAACDCVDGISVEFFGDEKDIGQIVRAFHVRVTDRQNFGKLSTLCGFSAILTNSLVLDGTTVNIQIAFDGEVVTVGSPLILSGY